MEENKKYYAHIKTNSFTENVDAIHYSESADFEGTFNESLESVETITLHNCESLKEAKQILRDLNPELF